MFTISKRFEFSASHVLNGLVEDHPCGRLHGHNYIVEAVLEGEPDERGFVYDYRDLGPFKTWIDDTLDHRHLNDMLAALQPSAENLAFELFEMLENMLEEHPGFWSAPQDVRPPEGPWFRVAAMRVSETPKTWAEYRP